MKETKRRYEHSQTMISECGKYGCLFLCLLSISEDFNGVQLDFLNAVEYCKKNGFIRDDFYVVDGLKMLEFLTGRKWQRKIVDELPKPLKDSEYTIECWRLEDKTHFRRRYFDSIKDSVIVSNGFLTYYYIYEVLT